MHFGIVSYMKKGFHVDTMLRNFLDVYCLPKYFKEIKNYRPTTYFILFKDEVWSETKNGRIVFYDIRFFFLSNIYINIFLWLFMCDWGVVKSNVCPISIWMILLCDFVVNVILMANVLCAQPPRNLHIVKPSTKSQCNFHCAMLDAGANCWYKEKYSGSGGWASYLQHWLPYVMSSTACLKVVNQTVLKTFLWQSMTQYLCVVGIM